WSATLPAGTSLALLQRQGETPTPDGSWSPFTAIAGNGATVGGGGRYLQYRADLATNSGFITPVVDAVQIACSTVADVTAPVISAVTATPGPTGTTATVAWTTDEFANSSVVYGTSPGALGTTVSSGVLLVSHSLGLTSLVPATTYFYRV